MTIREHGGDVDASKLCGDTARAHKNVKNEEAQQRLQNVVADNTRKLRQTEDKMQASAK